MATHSSVLAWRIPGTGEPGGLPSMGSHRVGHDWSDLAVAVAFLWWFFAEQLLSFYNIQNLGIRGLDEDRKWVLSHCITCDLMELQNWVQVARPGKVKSKIFTLLDRCLFWRIIRTERLYILMTRSPGHSCLGPCLRGAGSLGRGCRHSLEGRAGLSMMGSAEPDIYLRARMWYCCLL